MSCIGAALAVAILSLGVPVFAGATPADADLNVSWQKMIPVLVGAALALVGGLITQGLFLWMGRRHDRQVLLVVLRSELKVLRENLGTELEGYRTSLRKNQTPRPNVFTPSLPVFDANVGKLGQLRDKDLVEHLVEVYDSLHALRTLAQSFDRVPNEALQLRDLNEIHMIATSSHLQVMKLHNRLLKIPANGPLNQSDTEAETRRLAAEIAREVAAGSLARLLDKRWTDA